MDVIPFKIMTKEKVIKKENANVETYVDRNFVPNQEFIIVL